MPQADYLNVSDARVYYVTEGQGEPLLLLHGGLGSVEDFASQIPALAQHFRVIAFERTGHGHTADTSEAFTFESMVEQTASFIEALGLKAVNVVGWSDGAIVALLLAISRPDLVRRMISVGGLAETMAQSAETRGWIESMNAEKFPQEFVSKYGEISPDGPAHFSVVLEKTKKLWLTEPHIKDEDLSKIKAPTLVLAADKEDLPIEHTIEMFRAIKGAQLCIVPGATHFLMSEKPELTNSVMLAFLGEHNDAEQAK
ncbi:MAG: alpha/beta hydrolase [Nitrososphaerota archaeon]|nr:alpha/beta hydrolase [Nitrososphaerota archaeon]